MHNNFKVNTIKFLIIGGNTLWEEDDSLDIDADILKPNDIYCTGNKPIFSKNNSKIHLCEVDTKKTNIADFYKWDELVPENSANIFCWRTYTYLCTMSDTTKNQKDYTYCHQGNYGDYSTTNEVKYDEYMYLNIPESEKINTYSVSEIVKLFVRNK